MHFKIKDSVILASDEDPTLFTIHRFDNKMHSVFYLKAQDIKERDKWVQMLKMSTRSDLDPSPCIESNNTVNTCFICLDPVTESTVTMCGHLFCKNCIHKWIETKPVCPVCNSKIGKDKLIRLYGINDNNISNTSSNDNTNQSLVSNESPSSTEPQINRLRTSHNRPNISSEVIFKTIFIK